MRLLAAAAMVALLLATPLAARERPVWSASRTVDPITAKSSCVVAAYDQAAGMSLTRMGVIYPIVELNSEHGLLVGVSSGGRFRMPTGDILWRVDDLPHRELKAIDNPAIRPASMPEETVARVTQETLALTRSMTSTSTLASGETAWAMLDEMRRGRGLQYRQAAAASDYGLPQQQSLETGQITRKGLRPFPLDASFHAALAACGIGARPAPSGAAP